jgi:hypothetical protein
MLVTKIKTEFILFWTHQSHAYAYRVELPDGNYELVPKADEDLANAGVNVVGVQQGPDQSSEDFTTDCASEGKHRSISPFSKLCNYIYGCLCIYVQELNWNPSCMILRSYALILVC